MMTFFLFRLGGGVGSMRDPVWVPQPDLILNARFVRKFGALELLANGFGDGEFISIRSFVMYSLMFFSFSFTLRVLFPKR